jgi:leucyl aminopeptidase (aminopeptidase T)
VLEDEKAIGTVHIAFGDNKSMGGTIRVASHLDGVIMEPTVSVDGETIMEKGKLLIL